MVGHDPQAFSIAMSGQRLLAMAGVLVLAALFLVDRTGADEHPRARVQLAAMHSPYFLSVPWDLENPKVFVPLRLPQTSSGAAIFLGHVKNLGPSGMGVVGGDLRIRWGRHDRTYENIWKERLVEAGTVVVTPKNDEEIYFVSMEGDSFESWHFNLFNPLTSTLISLSCSWGPDDPMVVVKKSDNFAAPELAA
jgi:hypothetical protein